MAKAKTAGSTEQKNGALVFEEMEKGYEIPSRVRSGAYDETIAALQKTDKVVVVFRGGTNAKAANTRRKSLMKAAETKGLEILASVRNIDGDNVLLAQFKGKLAKE